ncbi:MAG: hypothetical protein ABIQ35_01875 [Verrucomicrobiota bacterium]
MLTAHELFGFMSPDLSARILETAYESDKENYRLVISAVAEARKLRPAFFERKPRTERHQEMALMLAKPRLEAAASTLIRVWLMKKHTQMLIDFLDALGIEHKEGVVDDLPPTIDDAKLKDAIEKLLAKYSREEVSVYLNAFYSMNDVNWLNLKSMLESDPRLQFGA